MFRLGTVNQKEVGKIGPLSSSQKTKRREEWVWGWKQDVDLAHGDDADVSQPAEVRAWPDRFWREGLT